MPKSKNLKLYANEIFEVQSEDQPQSAIHKVRTIKKIVGKAILRKALKKVSDNGIGENFVDQVKGERV